MEQFTNVNTTTFKLQDAQHVFNDISYMLGSPWFLLLYPLLLVFSCVAGIILWKRNAEDSARVLWWGACSAVIAVSLLIGVATFKPILIERYLAPFVPGSLLFIFLLFKLAARAVAQMTAVVLLLAMALNCALWASLGSYHQDTVIEQLNYEVASEDIMKSDVHHMIFAWDNPVARVMHKEQLVEFGSFFFRRAGVPMNVVPMTFVPTDDPNAQLLRAAQSSDAAIVWIYDTYVPGAAAIRHPPKSLMSEPSMNCRNSSLTKSYVEYVKRSPDAAKLTEEGPKLGVVFCIPTARRGP